MPDQVAYPKVVTAAWTRGKLRLEDEEAAKIGAALSDSNPEWSNVKDKASFAEVFLSCHETDPSVAADCRKALGKKPPTIFALPEDEDIEPLPADTTAKKAFGYFAECARACGERGDHKKATEMAALELLEYGGGASEAFKLAQETQHLKQYADLVAMARSVEEIGLSNALKDEGLEQSEAVGEAKASVAQSYTIGRMGSLAEMTLEAEDPIKALQEVAASLADAARNAAAHMQISSAPLGTDTAITVLRESIGIIEEHLEGSEDEDLAKIAEKARKAADGCEEKLIDRLQACEARIKSHAVREQALEASSLADEASRVVVKNLADAKKMEQGFLEANDVAKKACKLAVECAKFISAQPAMKANDQQAEALFRSIETAFQGARAAASEDIKATAKAAAEQQRAAKASMVAMQEAAKKASAEAKEKKPEPAAEEPAAAPAAAGAKGAREELLAALSKFAAKRWDTNLATQVLRRLTDRRKEVIGQLWEAVENDDDTSLPMAEKFVERFRNTMDARRRLDAVVRLMGRGESMDPRTAKWFTDSIQGISAKTADYVKARQAA